MQLLFVLSCPPPPPSRCGGGTAAAVPNRVAAGTPIHHQAVALARNVYTAVKFQHCGIVRQRRNVSNEDGTTNTRNLKQYCKQQYQYFRMMNT